MARANRVLCLAVFLTWTSLISAQTYYPICPPPSQKIESWNQCIGDYIFPNGVKYIGSWRNDNASGEGVLIFPNQTMFVGIFANDKAMGRGALLDSGGRIIKAGYANSPNIGEQSFLRMGDAYISESDGFFGHDQVSEYVKGIQSRLERYISTPSIAKSYPEQKSTKSGNNDASSDSKTIQKKQKCIRMGLNPGSDDFKMCTQQ